MSWHRLRHVLQDQWLSLRLALDFSSTLGNSGGLHRDRFKG